MNYIEIIELPETQNMADSSMIPVAHAGQTCKLRYDSLKSLMALFQDVTYNKTTGKFTFTRSDNTTAELSTDLQLGIKGIAHKSGDYKKLVLTHNSGTTEEIEVGTITGIQMNGTTVSSSGVANLGNIMKETELVARNLNDIMGVCGLYYSTGGNTCTNKPTGVDSFGMFVYRSAGGYYIQELTAGNNLAMKKYIRQFSGSWSSWTEMKLTDTTYSSKAAASGGTDVSLVTTGEKYTWTGKQDKLTAGTNITIDANNVISASGGGSEDYIIEFPSSWSSVIDEYEQAGSPDYFNVDILYDTYSGIDSDHEHYFVNTNLYNAIDRIMQNDITEAKLNLNNTTYDHNYYVSSAYISANGNDTLDVLFNDNAYVVSQDLGFLSISGKYEKRTVPYYTISCGISDISSFYTNAEFTSNKVTSISSSSTNTEYPSALAVYNYVNSAGGGITIDDVYPVGSIYMSVNNTNPSTLFGGTWEQLKDRFLLGAGDTYTAGNTGGEATHQLTKAELPSYDLYNASHSHTITSTAGYNGNQGNRPSLNGGNNQGSGNSSSGGATIKVSSGGSNTPHNNMPPYLVVYMWKRTA